MRTLEHSLRNKLHTAVLKAREIAERGAQAAVQSLGVGQPVVPAHLSEEQRSLRRRLRAHGRQLCDLRYKDGPKKDVQETECLEHEIAYEHWHRMLFARFLAENGLLMHPDGVAVGLEECQDLAEYEGANSGWELAGQYASTMLPQVFRVDSPALAISLPREHQRQLERLLADLDQEIFLASDSLGWVYQFWQTDKKEQINKSEVKIGASELPAVTQLFTEPYMVSFLLDNSLGAWWAARQLTEEDLNGAESEDELRQKASIPGVPLEYLRFIQDDQGKWSPAAGTFDSWPEQLRELKTLDPCCGSGHFLMAAFNMLVPMRIQREGLSAKEAVDAVLRDNLNGLEIDKRCVELAAFALALTAWRYPGAEGYRKLPELNLACSGLSLNMSKQQWTALAPKQSKLRNALDLLYDDFQMAPTLGSLLDPAKGVAARLVDFSELQPIIEKLLQENNGEEEYEAAVVAKGLAKAAKLLSDKYYWVITNVPYLARGKQSENLQNFCETNHKTAKNDLATVFLDRCLQMCEHGGTCSMVLPQNWLFLTSYKKFREKLLKNACWHLIARLGPGAFSAISGEVVKATLLSLSNKNVSYANGFLHKKVQDESSWSICGLDVSEVRSVLEKAHKLLCLDINMIEQLKQLNNPDALISLKKNVGKLLLRNYASSLQGLSTSDNPRFCFCFWEVKYFDNNKLLQSTFGKIVHFGGCESIVFLDKLIELYESAQDCAIGEDEFAIGRFASKNSGIYLRGKAAWYQKGVVVKQMGFLPVTLSQASPFDTNVAIILPDKNIHLPAIWCFCSSPDYNKAVRQIDQKLNVTNATLAKVPFDLDYWSKVAEEKYPHGLPQPYSDDPTQWIFHGHPCGSVIWDEETKWTAHGPLRSDETVLHVALARLLGYRWPAEQDPDMELADEVREWVNACQDLVPLADEDGIVCIPSVHGEARASERLLHMLEKAYGDAWSPSMLSKLLEAAGCSGKDLDHWLRNKFFEQHCKIFHNRPFIWHIWDGLKDGFSVLVNYHQLDRHNLERVIYTYLGDWIRSQQRAQAEGVDGAEERAAAAEGLKRRLEAILQGEKPLDIFVRWKSIDEQPIGWEPDINDGVRLNIRPFVYVEDVKYKNAGVLRKKPNINWNKDRGKDVESAPWYHLFQGERINDHHLSLAEKKEAREKAKNNVRRQS